MSIRGAPEFVVEHCVKKITDRRALSTMVVSELGTSPQQPTYKVDIHSNEGEASWRS